MKAQVRSCVAAQRGNELRVESKEGQKPPGARRLGKRTGQQAVDWETGNILKYNQGTNKTGGGGGSKKTLQEI